MFGVTPKPVGVAVRRILIAALAVVVLVGGVLTPDMSNDAAASTSGGCLATAMSAGWDHSLALGSDGRVYGTGRNNFGQLGDTTTTNRLSLVAMTGLPAGVTAIAVSAGAGHSLVVGSDGRAYSTGYNVLGQLGDGTTENRSSLVAMTGLPAGVTATAVSAGNTHSLVLGSDGRSYGTGVNLFGQLGDGTTAGRFSLVAMTGLPAGVTATAVEAGYLYSLVLGSDGRAYSTGKNTSGQLGDGTTADRSSLVAMTGLPAGVTATAVSAGFGHSLVLGSDGSGYGTGYNGWGELGDGTTTNRSSLVAMTGLPAGATATAVSAGNTHSLLLGSDGRSYGTGLNNFGQLGDGTTTNRSSLVAMSGRPDGVSAAAVSAGYHHSLVLGSESVIGTGWNEAGQLGDGTTTNRSSLVAMGPGTCHSGGLPYGRIVLSINRGRDYGMLAWAIDPETGAPPMLRVTVEGVSSREYEWNYQWADMPAHTGVNDDRSLVYLAQLPSGTRNVCFDALDPQGGGWTNLGCHSHTVK